MYHNKSIVELILSLSRLALLWSAIFFEGRLASFEEVGTLARLACAKHELRLLLEEFSGMETSLSRSFKISPAFPDVTPTDHIPEATYHLLIHLSVHFPPILPLSICMRGCA